ncbi:MAG TPA: transposase [Actinobacteria bacterium]|nr:transposase [Actinomycetota bacterium]
MTPKQNFMGGRVMARKTRVEFPGALYHVIARGNNRQHIFHSDDDYLRYLDKLRIAKKRYGFDVYAFCLMPNHIHLLLRTQEVPLSRIMRVVQTAYAHYFNRKHKCVGHVFQGRYKAILCDTDVYLLELIRYIHLNPVRANLTKLPHSYPWSSHQCYISPAEDEFVDKDAILSGFAKRKTQARGRFHAFVLERLAEGKREDLYKAVDQRLLGDDEFVESVRQRYDNPSKGKLLLSKGREVDLDSILVATAEQFSVEKADILGSTQSRGVVLARHMFIYIAKERFNIPGTTIAKHLQKDDSCVSRTISKIRDRLRADKDFEEIVDALSGRIGSRT